MNDKVSKVVIVEDNPGDALLVRRALEPGANFEAQCVESLGDLLFAVGRQTFDVVLLDLNLPDSRGLATLDAVRQAAPDTPVLIFTGLEDEELGIEAVSRGAQDYLVKRCDPPKELPRAIRYAIERKKTELKLRHAKEELEVRVRERTKELEDAMITLREEFDTRIAVETQLRQAQQQSLADLQTVALEITRVEQLEKDRLAGEIQCYIHEFLAATQHILKGLSGGEAAAADAVTRASVLVAESARFSESLEFELSPPVLAQEEFVPALKWLIDWIKDKHGLQVHLSAGTDPKLYMPEIRAFAFHAIRELLVNVVRHAGVTSACMLVGKVEGMLEIVVQDSGKGFSPLQVEMAGPKSAGLGLYSIKRRLRLLGGEMEIKSAAGKGARITLRIPIHPAKKAAA
jgi:signal transduction histidine kinase